MKDLVSDGFAQVVKPYIDAQDKTTREILAPVEADETDASRAYQIGDQLILGGILYDVIAPISQHGIITSTGSGANIEEADNITEQIGSVNSALTNLDAEVTTVENILGAKNLCPNNATDRVVSYVTFTVNTDPTSRECGVVTASGTASANAQLEIVASLKVDTTCILSGCPSGGGDSSYLLVAFDGTNYFSDSGNGVTLPSGTYRIYILIYSGASINDKFYPMIRPASVADDTYVPYAMTNREITQKSTWEYVDKCSINGGTISLSGVDYKELLIVAGVGSGSSNYGSFIIPKDEIAIPFYQAIYQDNSYHLNFHITYLNNILTCTQDSLSGWLNPVIKVYKK